MPLRGADALSESYDLCVVGSGPAGLACAFSAHDRGMRVLVLEAGGKQPIPGQPDILAADIAFPACHDPTDIVAAAALGGSSHWWGGRCSPFDEADFRFWPIAYDEMQPWWRKAAEFLGARPLVESDAPGAFAALRDFDARRDETWAPELNMARRWKRRIEAANGPDFVLDARVTALKISDGAVTGLDVRIGGETRRAEARQFVIACGGLGSVRLMLLAQRETPTLFGGVGGPLGRGYMGHLTGTIADIELGDSGDLDHFVQRPLGEHVFARRRIRPLTETILGQNIVNIAFWLDSAATTDAQHGSAVGSAKYLAARLAKAIMRFARDSDTTPIGAHIENVARAPLAAASGLAKAMSLLFAARITGRHPRGADLIPSAPGAWQLHYHAEQLPRASNRIALSDRTDSLGLPRLLINLEMAEEDFAPILRAHDLLDADLRAAGAGALRWRCAPEDRIERIRESSRDGYHQMGGAMMSADPADGVVDLDLKVHGLANLFVASACVFPSGGQANPTMTIVALASRLAEKLGAAQSARVAEVA